MVIMNFLYFDFSDGLEEIMPSKIKTLLSGLFSNSIFRRPLDFKAV